MHTDAYSVAHSKQLVLLERPPARTARPAGWLAAYIHIYIHIYTRSHFGSCHLLSRQPLLALRLFAVVVVVVVPGLHGSKRNGYAVAFFATVVDITAGVRLSVIRSRLARVGWSWLAVIPFVWLSWLRGECCWLQFSAGAQDMNDG